MAGDREIGIIIRVKNAATAEINKINAQIGKMNSFVGRLKGTFASIGSTVGKTILTFSALTIIFAAVITYLDKMGISFGNFSKKVSGNFKNVSSNIKDFFISFKDPKNIFENLKKLGMIFGVLTAKSGMPLGSIGRLSLIFDILGVKTGNLVEWVGKLVFKFGMLGKKAGEPIGPIARFGSILSTSGSKIAKVITLVSKLAVGLNFLKIAGSKVGDVFVEMGNMVASGFRSLQSNFLMVVAAIYSIKGAMDITVGAYIKQEEQTRNLNSTLSSLGVNVKKSRKEIDDWVDGLMTATSASEDAIISAFNPLAKVTGSVSKGMRLTEIALGMTGGKMEEVGGTVDALVMGINNAGRGLKKYNITVGDAKTKQEVFNKIIAQSGPWLSNLKTTLESTGGKLNQLKNYAGEAAEAIGKGLSVGVVAAIKVMFKLDEGGAAALKNLKKRFEIFGHWIAEDLVVGLAVQIEKLRRMTGKEAGRRDSKGAAAALSGRYRDSHRTCGRGDRGVVGRTQHNRATG